MSALPTIRVNAEICCHDGICTTDCPMGLLEMKNGIPRFREEAEKDCVLCGHCMAVCPNGALSLNEMKPNECASLRKKFNYDETFQLLAGRRSIRKYKDQPVGKKEIEYLLNLVRMAPTAKNTQLVEWIVYNSPEDIKKIVGMTVDLFRTLIKNNNPIASAYRLERHVKAWENGEDAILRGAPALVIAHTPTAYGMGVVDSTIALTYLDLAAPSLGLGSCWAGILMLGVSQSPELAQKLRIPENHSLRGALMLGYPKNKYFRIPPRNEPKILWA